MPVMRSCPTKFTIVETFLYFMYFQIVPSPLQPPKRSVSANSHKGRRKLLPRKQQRFAENPKDGCEFSSWGLVMTPSAKVITWKGKLEVVQVLLIPLCNVFLSAGSAATSGLKARLMHGGLPWPYCQEREGQRCRCPYRSRGPVACAAETLLAAETK